MSVRCVHACVSVFLRIFLTLQIQSSPSHSHAMAVGACQSFCGQHQAAQCFPFPEALGSLAWPQHTVFMSCVIADLSLSRRPASVEVGSCSLQARSEPHHLQQSEHISHHPLPDGARRPRARRQNRENEKVLHFDPCNYFLCIPNAAVKQVRVCAHTQTHTCLNIQTHDFSFAAPKAAMGAHTRSEEAAVKWGPVWELLAGLVETAEAWSSLTAMTRASSPSLRSRLVCCSCSYC